MVEVTQEDKQAAARYLVAIVPEMPALAARVMESQTALSRAFARHRIAARKRALEEAAATSESIGEQYGEDETGWLDCSETIATAIRKLVGEGQ